MALSWVAKREYGLSLSIGKSKVNEGYNIHPYDHIIIRIVVNHYLDISCHRLSWKDDVNKISISLNITANARYNCTIEWLET